MPLAGKQNDQQSHIIFVSVSQQLTISIANPGSKHKAVLTQRFSLFENLV